MILLLSLFSFIFSEALACLSPDKCQIDCRLQRFDGSGRNGSNARHMTVPQFNDDKLHSASIKGKPGHIGVI
ncbi:hypothetical protein DXT89_23595 [Agrobacterium vitis]|uniref:Uncharacterized protein n=1 Tax=Agrobacterium vitis TaxID=373 RepID=A0A368NZY2_AGRVI|nr:hypothetical protein DXM22_23020 [Agrobacterium vitis]KAA3521098.1 hypothetical protein DXT89_23595 [Agrobacterium vitis]RCU55706.1 hypothetical protein ASB66_001740 [Agrobacterium vitis]